MTTEKEFSKITEATPETVLLETDKLIKDIEEKRESFKKEAQKVFKKLTDLVFNQFPKINSITWCQYTPYFNDGEECVFTLHEPCFSNASAEYALENIEYGQNDGEDNSVEMLVVDNAEFSKVEVWDIPTRSLRPFSEEEKFSQEDYVALGIENQQQLAILNALNNLMDSDIGHHILKDTFGNDVKVVASREGFAIADYEHD